MKMLRRVAIVSAVGLLICLIATAVLAPMAISDAQKLSWELDAIYSKLTEELALPKDGVKTVSLNGSYIQRLQLGVSEDDQIHVYTNGYRLEDASFPYSLSSDGHLQITHIRGDRYFYPSFNQENLLRSMAADFNNKGLLDLEITLPAGVSFDLSTNTIWHVDVDPNVETYHSAPKEPEESPVPIQDSPHMQAEETLRIGANLRDCNEELRSAYQKYGSGTVDEEQVRRELEGILDRMAKLLAEVPGNSASQLEMEEDFLSLGLLQMEKNLIELRQKRYQQDYHAGHISKEEFYETDLQLDNEKEEAENNLLDQRPVVEELQEIERRVNVDVLLDEDADIINYK